MMSRSRAAVSAAELAIAVLILGAGLVPMYSTFVKSSRSTSQSRLAFLGMHIARETLEEVRQIPFERLATKDWRSVSGPIFAATVVARAASPANHPLVGAGAPTYPAEYKRLQVRTTVADAEPPDERLRRVIVEVRWQETGAGSEKQPEALARYETLVGRLSPQ